MTHYICATCGTQFPDSPEPPAHCPACEDERQYIGWQGQKWTTLDALRSERHNHLKTEEPNLTGIGTEPSFAIGQRALLIQTPGGNVLWESTSLIDDETITAVKALGGIKAIAISHPHYYSSMIEWSKAFDAPIYLNELDRQYVVRPDPAIQFWQGDAYALQDGLTIVRCGGHFAGSTVLHWPAGAERRGVLLAGDTIYVVSDRRYVSFMRSYPNHIPLPPRTIQQIVNAVEPFAYDRIYSAWYDRTILANAKAAVHQSAERYIRAITEGFVDS